MRHISYIWSAFEAMIALLDDIAHAYGKCSDIGSGCSSAAVARPIDKQPEASFSQQGRGDTHPLASTVDANAVVVNHSSKHIHEAHELGVMRAFHWALRTRPRLLECATTLLDTCSFTETSSHMGRRVWSVTAPSQQHDGASTYASTYAGASRTDRGYAEHGEITVCCLVVG